MPKPMTLAELSEGLVLDFGSTTLTEEQIIAFATEWDPLSFHIDREAAKKTIFGRIIASGPQVFMVTHKREWIPRFKETVIAGTGIDKWRLLRPVFPDMRVHCKCAVVEIKPSKRGAQVLWTYEFRDDAGALIQSMEMRVLHR